MNPKVLHGLIVKNNASVFNTFIEFPKPIIIAANGPAIGAWYSCCLPILFIEILGAALEKAFL
jgi:enoyl-CoA hydratase/carnithine racemase